jgi:hypothetical protein
MVRNAIVQSKFNYARFKIYNFLKFLLTLHVGDISNVFIYLQFCTNGRRQPTTQAPTLGDIMI